MSWEDEYDDDYGEEEEELWQILSAPFADDENYEDEDSNGNGFFCDDEDEIDSDELSNEFADEQDQSAVSGTTNQSDEEKSTMTVNKQKPEFTPVTITFSNEGEFQDVIAALAAYGRKSAVVHGTSIASDLKLSAYTGNCRATVNKLLPQLTATI